MKPPGPAVIREIWRYPVKSMAGERLESCSITEHGLEGDRVWALIDGTEPRTGKFFNIKQHARLMQYRARLVGGKLEVSAPDGTGTGLDEALKTLVRESSHILNLRRQAGANFDDAPVHIVNLASVEAFALEAGMPMDHRRFRANLYVDGLEPDEEIGWLGRRIRAGDAELEVIDRCVRCAVITRDPDTTVATPALLELLVDRHEKCLGMYCRVVRPGRATLGDPVGPI
ncbi:MAG TPA: MOSC N-terminal beta barrel domain-containing protein [Candidatus Udaeobacter sp.]|nr:MOSC N-terminal beta barrel domain-containing protein [Candidatus Udaeobacter sp.]